MRGAEHEITDFLVDQGYKPVGHWHAEGEYGQAGLPPVHAPQGGDAYQDAVAQWPQSVGGGAAVAAARPRTKERQSPWPRPIIPRPSAHSSTDPGLDPGPAARTEPPPTRGRLGRPAAPPAGSSSAPPEARRGANGARPVPYLPNLPRRRRRVVEGGVGGGHPPSTWPASRSPGPPRPRQRTPHHRQGRRSRPQGRRALTGSRHQDSAAPPGAIAGGAGVAGAGRASGFRRSCVVSGSPESRRGWRTGSLVPGWASGR